LHPGATSGNKENSVKAIQDFMFSQPWLGRVVSSENQLMFAEGNVTEFCVAACFMSDSCLANFSKFFENIS
jgi:hypothetical protein